MTLWFVFALMTAAAIFAVLWPLSRGSRPPNEGSEAAVYKDQLTEITRFSSSTKLMTGFIPNRYVPGRIWSTANCNFDLHYLFIRTYILDLAVRRRLFRKSVTGRC